MCQAITPKGGKTCTKFTSQGEKYCFFHKKVRAGEIALMRPEHFGTNKMFDLLEPVKVVDYPRNIRPVKAQGNGKRIPKFVDNNPFTNIH